MSNSTKDGNKSDKGSFLKEYPDNKTELNYQNSYQLLVSVILSAQCTDKRVNILTPAFFKRFPNTKELSTATVDEVKEFIKIALFSIIKLST